MSHLLSWLLVGCFSTAFAQSSSSSEQSYVLPMFDAVGLQQRQQQISGNQRGYVYGPSLLLSNVSSSLTGQLGDALVAADVKLFDQEGEAFGSIIQLEAQEVIAALSKSANTVNATKTSGLEELSPFLGLYLDQWRSSNPDGLDPGAYTNFTQDLYFSMQRLSTNPYSLSRITPNATLPFTVSDNITTALAGVTLADLQQAGRLFMVDYSTLAILPRQPGRFAAACTALFYIHPDTALFLPLAIKTNEGANLTYTPLDSANDWFLAKTLFESNDALFAEMFHLGATHAVAGVVHAAALRTMADVHPLRGYLDKLMFRAYAIFIEGANTLFNPGGPFDLNLAFSSPVALDWATQLYQDVSGHFQANYLGRWLTDRGLIDCPYGPTLEHFPFYDEATTLVEALRSFTEVYIGSYYPTDELLSEDNELQAWLVEANSPAQVLDFPPAPLTSRTMLVDILTQMTYLTGLMHHVLNAESLASSRFLPLHPLSHYQPLPTTKGIESVVPFLPNTTQALKQITLLLEFNRPMLRYEGLDLLALFADPGFLDRTNTRTQMAAVQLQSTMANLSAVKHGKRFDSDGLSQGMPFIWRTLDPLRLPSFLSI